MRITVFEESVKSANPSLSERRASVLALDEEEKTCLNFYKKFYSSIAAPL